MKRGNSNQTERLATRAMASVLSADPATREIEIAFVKRLLDAAPSGSVVSLDEAAGLTPQEQVSATYTRMEHPGFGGLSRALERLVPDTRGFGRFDDGA